ncbi:MAG: translocation/assembly module TamB domain-containing protein, partial [Cyclonatronaceae bacterium]
EGVVRTLGNLEEAPEDTPLADLNIEVGNVDLWFLPLILQNIFTDAGGQGSGSGQLQVLRDGDIRYDSDFEVRNGRLRPVFLDAPLQVNGDLSIDSENGAIFNDMPVSDGRDGSGTLSGQVDFGIGQSETLFDLQLAMENLRFMDNSDGPDMPFFGTGIGSGTVELTGSSNAPYISTPSPVRMASSSNMSIPLDTEESVESGGRFIQFVDSFDQSYEDLYSGDFTNSQNGEEEEEVDLTFMEKFEFDLRFESDEAMSVRLIFDEVTSEVLSARGTGRIRLSLQDEVFQVFGEFDVEGGDYLFVGGDLFARQFDIQEGGTISWEGDPVNANIDVSAAYRARPDVNQLRGTAGPDATPVRVPVDLILNISGTLESIENEFYFEFPSGTDVSQTATIAATLNSEDTKLLQATSILLTGNFVPVDTGLNDLFTSQIGAQGLGTLLSSQISSLLNSNISNLDINLNMTGFDEADLGIALYLFDDRLTLRREVRVTGPNSNIGDFDVTYRINEYLSLEAFHRRESLLPSAVSVGQAQTDESYGAGIEARVQFNTWGEFGQRLIHPFRRNSKPEDEAETDSESEEESENESSGVARQDRSRP